MADAAEQTPARDASAARWHDQLQLASKTEREWREESDRIVERYRGELAGNRTRLNILSANVELLKPAVFSHTPSPEVRRRNLREDPLTQATGRQVATLLEKALEFEIDDNFDQQLEAARDDLLLTGRGVTREVYAAEIIRREDIAYIPASIDPMTGLPTPALYLLDGQPVEPEFSRTGEPFVETKIDERVETRHVFWADFRMSPARCWDDVTWVAFRHAMTRAELRKQFPEVASVVPLSIAASSGEGYDGGVDHDSGSPKDPPAGRSKAEVWEVWDRRKRERTWVASGFDKVLRVDPDPLGLADFFPCPEPVYHLRTTDTLVPLPEFNLYRDQAAELDEIQDRIRKLVQVMRAVVLCDGDFSEIVKIANAVDGQAIPIERPDAVAEDIGKAIFWWPIQQIQGVIATLSGRAEQLKAQIHELTGISDLQRGFAEPRVTAAAERTKTAYGAARMTPRSLPIQRHIRDVLRLKAEIMSELFDPANLERISGVEVTPDMLALLRDEKIRNTSINVATDSTIRPDAAQEKQEAVEFLTVATPFIEQAVMVASQAPLLAPLYMAMLKEAARAFKFSRGFEDILNATADQMVAMAMQPPPMMPNPGGMQ